MATYSQDNRLMAFKTSLGKDALLLERDRKSTRLNSSH